MVIKNDENEIVFTTKGLNLYDMNACAETRSIIEINGKKMTVKEFKELKSKGE